MTNAQAKTRYSYLIDSKYSHFLTIFTDRSKITLPELSVSAAVAVPSIEYVKKWKLSINITVLGAELFAIK